MKKLLTILLILCMFTLVGCGSVGSGAPPFDLGPGVDKENGEGAIPSDPENNITQKISSLYTWIEEIGVNDVLFITSKSNAGPVSPDLFSTYNQFQIATESTEIQEILNKIKNLKVKRAQGSYLADSGFFAVTIHLKNGNDNTLTSNYGGFYFDNEYYVFSDCNLPVCSTYYGKQFLSNAVWNMKLFYNDALVENFTNATCANFLHDIIYTVNQSLDYVQDERFLGYSFKDSSMGEIKIVSDNQFLIITENELKAVCTIKNNVKFSDFINV